MLAASGRCHSFSGQWFWTVKEGFDQLVRLKNNYVTVGRSTALILTGLPEEVGVKGRWFHSGKHQWCPPRLHTLHWLWPNIFPSLCSLGWKGILFNKEKGTLMKKQTLLSWTFYCSYPQVLIKHLFSPPQTWPSWAIQVPTEITWKWPRSLFNVTA